MYCKFCGREIHESAVSCPGCGAVQSVHQASSTTAQSSSSWMAVTSLITGLLGMITLLDDSKWDTETVVGIVVLFACPAAIWGVWTLAEKRGGRNMAIAGVVMSAIVFVSCLEIGINL